MPVLRIEVPPTKFPQHGEELTLADGIGMKSLTPGRYRLEVVVTDNVAKRSITPEASFTVKAEP